MNTPNPLIPQGSLEAQQHQKRSATKIVVSSILAVHGVVLGGLLFLGCKEEPEIKTADTGSFESLDAPYTGSRNPEGSSPFGDLGIAANQPIEIPATEPLPMETNLGDTFPPLPPGTRDNFGTPPSGGSTPPITVAPEPAKRDTYAVLPGDNFWTIAKKHNVTVPQITAANPTADPRRLKVGQVLNLPANVSPVAPAIPRDTPESGTAGDLTHTVKSGDTLSKLSRDYKVSIKAIQQANNLRGSVIRVGQKLIIPAGGSSSSGR